VAALQERGSGWLGRERDVPSQQSISLYSYSTLMSLTLYSYVSHTLLLCLSHNSVSHCTRITHTHTLSVTNLHRGLRSLCALLCDPLSYATARYRPPHAVRDSARARERERERERERVGM
jgi:hypothetical protein